MSEGGRDSVLGRLRRSQIDPHDSSASGPSRRSRRPFPELICGAFETKSPLSDSQRGSSIGGGRNGDIERATVLFIGCDSEFWARMKRGLSGAGFECARVSGFNELTGIMMGQEKPSVVVLGTEHGQEDISQIAVLKYIKRLSATTKVVFISDEKNPNSAWIIANGADDIVGKDNLKPRQLAKSVESVIMLSSVAPPALEAPIICELKDGKVMQVDDTRVEKVRETMTMFALNYDNHQRFTRHYAVMNALLTAYQDHFGGNILDAGCGTGHPMRLFIRDVMVPQFMAKLRESTRILSIDSTLAMMVEAQAGFKRLKEQHPGVLEGNLEMDFLLTDMLSLTPQIAACRGFTGFDTILASYIMHWANDKEGTVRKFSELMAPGGKLITIEEWNPMVTPGPFMPKELAEKIEENILPVNRKRYYDMLRGHGFSDVIGGVMVIDIDAHHQMYGNVFQKD